MADKRLFEQGSDVDPILTHRVAMGLAGNTTKNSTWSKIVTWLQTALQDATHRFITDTERTQWDAGTGLQQTLVSIGVWDMDATDSVNVAHGITNFEDIVSISGVIYNDAIDTSYPFPYIYEPTNRSDLILGVVDATNINLIRKVGGTFDAATFDDGVMNRGYLVIFSII
jgi:flagellar biosynthesis regulator FlaF